MAVCCGELCTAAVSEDGDVIVMGTWNPENYAAYLRPNFLHWRDSFGSPVVSVAAGKSSLAATTEDGTLWTWGSGEYGKLGHGNEESMPTPVKLAADLFGGVAVVQVACGAAHTLSLTADGEVYSFGCGSWGRLGLGDVNSRDSPTLLYNQFDGKKIGMVVAGYSHSMAVSVWGEVFTWGCGRDGCLGIKVEDKLVPTCLSGKFGGPVAFVAAGRSHSVAVEMNGTRMWSWGNGNRGKLGLGDTAKRFTPTLLDSRCFGSAGIVSATCGDDHTLAVTEDGDLWSWGAGIGGRLGHGHDADVAFPRRVEFFCPDSKVVLASAGSLHSVALTADGSLYSFGSAALELTRDTDSMSGDEDLAAGLPLPPLSIGLGHGDLEDKVLPTCVDVRSVRLGRCRRLPSSHALAFAMATHARLGARSVFAGLVADLVRRIVYLARSWPRGYIASCHVFVGCMRLLGGEAGMEAEEESRLLNLER